jgi:hypothetical protein
MRFPVLVAVAFAAGTNWPPRRMVARRGYRRRRPVATIAAPPSSKPQYSNFWR